MGGEKAEQNSAGGLVALMTRRAISAEDWIFRVAFPKMRGEETVK